MPIISDISPSADARTLAIRVDRRRVATLSAQSVAALGLAVGRAWDESLAAQVRATVTYESALRRATARIARRALSGAEAQAQLVKWGYESSAVKRAHARLCALGLVDDEKFGRALIEETLLRKPAGAALLRQKLLRRGLEEALVERLVAKSCETVSVVDEALALARAQVMKMGRLEKAARTRRLWGILGRRGFDEDTVRQVMERLGLVED